MIPDSGSSCSFSHSRMERPIMGADVPVQLKTLASESVNRCC